MRDGFGGKKLCSAYGFFQQCFHWGTCFAVLLCLAAHCFAETPPLPSYVVFPAQMQVQPNSVEEDYGEAQFLIDGQPDSPIEMGKHWYVFLRFSGASQDLDDVAIWAQLKPALVRSGWTVLSENPGHQKTARYQKDGHNSWLMLWIQSVDDLRMDLVEVGPLPLTLKLNKPAKVPETVDAKTGDFPYLSPIPGSQSGNSIQNDEPMLVDVDIDQNTHEQQVVGSASITKSYTVPASLQSAIFFFTVYRDALKQAGWTIVHQVQNINGSDAVLSAHYSADGRDIWATLHGGGTDYSIQVADTGTEDIGKELDQDCHVALYGIQFDFNKATIRPDSEPVLNKVLVLLKARPTLKLEVQGHTDNVGGNAYNQKLSEARANAVVAWLSAKGIAADRLTAKGYGMTMPIADNGSDEGRAKNRRVELKKQDCTK